MDLEVKLYGPLRHRAGTDSLTIVLENDKLSSAIHQLCKLSQLKDSLLKANGEFCRSVIYLIGDNQVNVEDNPSLKSGDVLTLLAPISGG